MSALGAPPRLVLVTDPRYDLERTCSVLREAAEILGGPRLLVQLRDKEATESSLLASARALRSATREVGALLTVNGSVSVAERAGADGVHLPGRATAFAIDAACRVLGRDAFVTVAAHDDDDVRRALEGGAGAVLVSPIFATPGKGPARGLAAIRAARAIVDAARQALPLRVYALGGITGANAAACVTAGADGVAAIRALYEDGGALCRLFRVSSGG